MGKFTVSLQGGELLVVRANRPQRAAQKYADGKSLPPDSVIDVENQAARRWHYVVGHQGTVRRIKSQEAGE